MGRVSTPTLTEDGIALVASPLDLLGTKLKVIMQRAEAKDYEDIAQLLRSGQSLIPGSWGRPCVVWFHVRAIGVLAGFDFL